MVSDGGRYAANGETYGSVRPAILLVEDDDDARPGMRRMLEAEGYRVLVTIDERDAHELTGSAQAHADLILLDQGMSPEETLAAGRRIRDRSEHCRTAPVVVIASDYEDSEEGTDDQITSGEWVTYLEDAEQLRALLNRLLR